MPPPIAALTREMLKDPVTLQVERQAKPAVGITQAVYPVAQDLKSALFVALLKGNVMKEALVFTRTKHRANRLADYLVKQGVNAARIHGNRSQTQRTEALAGFKSGKYRVLVATDIAARGIDVEALGHVVNFDVPMVPEDYIHRVGRTARAEMTGDAFTFVSPGEEGELREIEKAIGSRLPRVTVPDFDYSAKPEGRFEVPLAERIAAIRARKAEERARARAKEERRASSGGQIGAGQQRSHRPISNQPRPVSNQPARAPHGGSSSGPRPDGSGQPRSSRPPSRRGGRGSGNTGGGRPR
jgi:ATP-dependent RNA helicase RhlE